MLKNKIMFPLTSTNILYQRSPPYPSDIFFHESVTFNLSSLHWTYTHVIHKITLPIKAQNISLTNDVFHGTHFPSSSTPSMSHRRPCVSHKGTKDSATVTDWMLHTARVSETQAHFFMWSWQFHHSLQMNRDRQASLGLSSKKTAALSSFFVMSLLLSQRQ